LCRRLDKEFTPRATARLITTFIEVITDLVDRGTAEWLRCGVGYRAPVPDHLCTPRRNWAASSVTGIGSATTMWDN